MKSFTDYLEIIQEMKENKTATSEKVEAMQKLLAQEPISQIIGNLLADKENSQLFKKWYAQAQGELVQKLGYSWEKAWDIVQKTPKLKKLWNNAIEEIKA